MIPLDGSISALVDGGKGGFRLIQRDGTKYLFTGGSPQEAKQWMDEISASNTRCKELPLRRGTLELSVVAAKDLVARDAGGPSPFVVAYLNSQLFRTHAVEQQTHPVWAASQSAYVMKFNVADLKVRDNMSLLFNFFSTLFLLPFF